MPRLSERELDEAWEPYMPDDEDRALVEHVFEIEPQGLHQQGRRRIEDET